MLIAEQIARIAHEANRAYCTNLGDHTIPSWDAAPVWQRDSAIAGVKSALVDPSKTPEQSHFEWMEFKLKAGWKFGPTKRPEALEHPCLVPWSELPEEQKTKDRLFLAIVRAAGVIEAVTVGDLRTDPPVEMRKDLTEEVGILTATGEVVKDAEIVAAIKPSKKSKRFGG
jgi:hypothetical protein